MRNSTDPADRRLADLAARQHGVVSVAQMRALGLDRFAVARRAESGRLHRLYRGVYAVGHTVVSWRGAYLAAVLACGEGAVLSHRSAAYLWGVRPTSAPRIDVTVPRTSGVRSHGRIVVHRPLRPAETTSRDGIRVTTPGRTLADLALALPRRELEKAAEMAEVHKLHVQVDPDHPGAKRLAATLESHDLGTDTRTRAAFERDRSRDAVLTAIGRRVMRFTRRQVRGEPATVGARVISARSPLLVTP